MKADGRRWFFSWGQRDNERLDGLGAYTYCNQDCNLGLWIRNLARSEFPWY
jgi:hypothetical protein